MERLQKMERQTSNLNNSRPLRWYHIFKDVYYPAEQEKIAQMVQRRDYFSAIEKTLNLPAPTNLSYDYDSRYQFKEELMLRSRVVEQGIKSITSRMKEDTQGDGK